MLVSDDRELLLIEYYWIPAIVPIAQCWAETKPRVVRRCELIAKGKAKPESKPESEPQSQSGKYNQTQLNTTSLYGTCAMLHASNAPSLITDTQ